MSAYNILRLPNVRCEHCGQRRERRIQFWFGGLDRWACDNHNSVTLARSGAGKSYLTKLEVLRSLYTGVRVTVIDPEDEYTRLADPVGGTVVHLGAPGVRLNPLDLPVQPLHRVLDL